MPRSSPEDTHDRHSDFNAADHAQAEHVAQRLGSSAQHIWLAGLGALGRVQEKGGQLFNALVREGEQIESRQRNQVRDKGEHFREKVENHVDDALDGARRQWDRLSRGFDDRLHSALRALKVPDQHELTSLRREIEELRSQVEQLKTTFSSQPSRTSPPPLTDRMPPNISSSSSTPPK